MSMIDDARQSRASCRAPLALAVSAALLSAAPTIGSAQGQRSGGLEEIVVTARYREENIQTTPIAISAFSGEELTLRSIDNVEDIGVIVPNAFFRKNVGNYGPNNTIGLRGLNQVDFSYSFEPAVGIYIDDIYHGTITGSDMDLVDLERVEVLRGPQGTLFGKNSLGGAMRLISRPPSGDNTGNVQLTVGEFDRLDVRATGDFALTENIYVRLTGVSKRRDGYGRRLDFACEMVRRGTPELAGINDGIGGATLVDPGTAPFFVPIYEPVFVPVGSPEDNRFAMPMARDPRQGDCTLGTLGGEEMQAGRMMLRIMPSDRFEVTVSADFSSTSDDPNVETQLSPVMVAPTSADQRYENAVIFANYGVRFINTDRFLSPDPYSNYSTHADPFEGQTYPTKSDMEAWGTSIVLDYDLTERTHFKLITGYRTYDTRWSSDTDRMPFPIQQTDYLQEHEQTQIEAQFTGSIGERFDWTAGAFYYDSKSRAYNTTEFGAFDYGPGGPGTGSLPNFVADDRYTTENKSVFVHVNYALTERLSLSGGVRYTDEEKSNTFAHYGQIVVPDPLVFGKSRADQKISIDFSVTDNIFLYAQAATGYRSEGANPRIFTVGQLGVIPEEEVTTYEIGVKTDLLDRRLRLNAAVFESDYDPRTVSVFGLVVQCDAPDDPNPTPYFLAGAQCPAGTALAGSNGLPWFYYINNPGTLEGFEVELSASPIDQLLVTYTVGQTRYKNDNQTPGSPLYVHPSFLLQPEWTMSAGVQWTARLPGGGTLSPRLDAFYQSHRTNGGTQVDNFCPERCIPGYTLLNARLTYQPPSEDWSVSLSATNLADRFYWQQLGAAITATGAPASNRSGVPGRPREWALTLEKRF